MSIELQLIIMLFCMFFSAFFSGSEIAIFSANKLRIRTMAEEGNKNAKILQSLLSCPNRLISTILIGNNIVNITATAVGTSLAIQFFGIAGVGIATATMTLFILIFAEVTPKAIAAENCDKISLFLAKPLFFFIYLFFPLSSIFTMFSNYLIRFLGGKIKKDRVLVTEEEIKMLVAMGAEEGTIQKQEKEMIHSIFEFGDKTAKDIMQPRTYMKAINANLCLDEALKVILSTHYSRLPVYEENIDHIIGITNSKDLIAKIRECKKNGYKETSLRDIIRPSYIIPSSKKLDSLLRDMQKERVHMAIVVDEYGGTVGLVTLEDILEEIVGDILDETDVVESNLQIINEKNILVEAKTSIEDVNEALHLSFPSHNFNSLGGLILDSLGKIPQPGEKIEIGNIILIVESMRGKRITKVRILLP